MATKVPVELLSRPLIKADMDVGFPAWDASGKVTVGGALVEGSADFVGLRMKNNFGSGVENATYVDSSNENDVATSAILFANQTDGGSRIDIQTTPAGSRLSNRRVNVFGLNSKGVMTLPNQPFCIATRGVNAETFVSGNKYGILGSFTANPGSQFTAGGNVGTSGTALHVPYTGKYLIMLKMYKQGTTSGRINVQKNQATGLCFIQVSGATSEMTLSSQTIAQLNSGDYLNYACDIANVSMYSAGLHTEVAVYFLG